MASAPKVTNDSRFVKLEERADWHQKFGWGAASLLGAALLGTITWWMPHESDELRTSMRADTASQLEPLKIDLAKVYALLQLKQTGSVAQAVNLGVDFSKPKTAYTALQAIVVQAKIDQLIAPLPLLFNLNEQIKTAVKNNPDLIAQAWSTQISLVTYRSSLPSAALHDPDSKPASIVSNMVFSNGSTSDTHQRLDGSSWENWTFTNVAVEYDGGPLLMRNVTFVNCTFNLKYSKQSNDFTGMLLAQNAVTGSLA